MSSAMMFQPLIPAQAAIQGGYKKARSPPSRARAEKGKFTICFSTEDTNEQIRLCYPAQASFGATASGSRREGRPQQGPVETGFPKRSYSSKGLLRPALGIVTLLLLRPGARDAFDLERRPAGFLGDVAVLFDEEFMGRL